MSNNIVNHIRDTIGRLATDLPDLEKDGNWTGLVQDLDQLSRTVSHQELLLETGSALSEAASSISDLDEFIKFTADLIKNGFDFHYVGIYLIDDSNEWVVLRADTNYPDNLHTRTGSRLALDDGDATIVRTLKQQEPIFSGKPAIAGITSDSVRSATLLEVTIPLVSRGQAIGVLVIQSGEQGLFDPDGVRAMQPLTDQLANTIHNATLLSRADRQLGQLLALQNINLQLGSQFNLEMLLSNVAIFSTKLLNADTCIVRLADEQHRHFVIKATYDPPDDFSLDQTEPYEESPSSKVVDSWQAIIVNDWPNHPLAAQFAAYHDRTSQSLALLIVPLNVKKKIIGTIEVHSRAKRQAFNENDLYALSLLAAQTATAITNTQLFNQAESSYRFLETVIEHIPDPILIKNQDHTWVAVNQATADLIGQPKQDVIGHTDRDLFAPDLAAEYHRRDETVFETNQIAEFEDKTVWGDGQEHTGYTRLIPIHDADGQPEYLLSIINDITERKAHEAERERYLAETEALYNGSQAIANALSERQIFEALFEQIQLEKPCEISAYTLELVEGEPIWAELKANWQKRDLHTHPIGTRLYLPETVQARLLVMNEPLFVEDIASDTRLSGAERQGFAPTQAKSLAILPLAFMGQQLGFVAIYFTSPQQISAVTQRFWLAMVDQAGVALSNSQLVQEATYRVIQMETAAEVAHAASSLLDLNELLNSSVALIRDRFSLYYVGAFLIDENNEWAVLRAGTGEAGRIQLEKNHRLKIGGESMIGWSIHNQQPRIALDVGQDAVHFQNPDLPDTRSEMALPLIHRNQTIGALTVQSVEQAAFSREDIIFLQTMANQLANAIENARLFSQAQQEIAERGRVEEALRSSETEYRELVENANSIILRIDTAGRITFFNEFAQSFFGFREDEIVGQPVIGTIVPHTDAAGRDLSVMFEDIFANPENYTSNENENITRDGTRVWVSWANRVIGHDDSEVMEILCIGNDATERKQAEEEILRRNKELAAINHITTSIATVLDLEAILQATARELVQVFEARNCGIALLNAARTELTVVADYSYSENEPEAKGAKIPLAGNLSSSQVIEGGQSVVVPNAQTNPLTAPIHDLLRERRTECLMIVPLRVRGEVIGTFGIESTEKRREFVAEEVTLAETIASQVASAIENARLFEQMQEALTELEEAEQENRQLLAQAQHRSELLQTAAEVSRAASSILDVDDLINTSVNLIRDHFDFYYVGLFIVDDAREWAVLQAGTGEAGRIQLEKKHQLKIGGGESMIGWSVHHGRARIALDVGEDAVHFQNPDLPDTRSEMALPLKSRDDALGALTVQSIKREAFSNEDVVLLQTMADQLANALANAGLFENATQARQEAESRLGETQALQQFSQRLAGTLEVSEILDIFFNACTDEIGFEYVQFSLVDKAQHRIKAMAGIGLSDSQIERSSHILDSEDIMADIVRMGQTEIIGGWDDRFDRTLYEAEGHADWMRIFTPITLRQENIGLVEAGFNRSKKATITDSQVRMLRAFINQAALALDNAQRYEASQRAARREALIKEITTKVRASNDLDTILRTTVKEVGDAIGRKRTFIQLLSQRASNGNPSSGSDSSVGPDAEADRRRNGG